MTDKEILETIKNSREYCDAGLDCDGCPIFNREEDSCWWNVDFLFELAQRQQAEIDRLNKEHFLLNGRMYVESTGECPICEDCPHNCPLELVSKEMVGDE